MKLYKLADDASMTQYVCAESAQAKFIITEESKSNNKQTVLQVVPVLLCKHKDVPRLLRD